MKYILMTLIFSVCFFSAFSQSKAHSNIADTTKKVQIVDASCGQCKFGLKGGDCDLAIRIGSKAYFVDGTDIDSPGDAHAQEGFCNAIRKAEVQGEIVDGRFKATYFKLRKPELKKE